MSCIQNSKKGASPINTVKSIRKEVEFEKLYKYLFEIHPRYGIMLYLGADVGLRVSDMLELKASMLSKRPYTLIERKTGKSRTITLSDTTRLLVAALVATEGIQENEYIFYSRPKRKDKHLHRSHVYRIFKQASVAAKLPRIGTHTMRKTYAVRHYQTHKDLQMLQSELNHKYLSTTLLYISDILEDLI